MQGNHSEHRGTEAMLLIEKKEVYLSAKDATMLHEIWSGSIIYYHPMNDQRDVEKKKIHLFLRGSPPRGGSYTETLLNLLEGRHVIAVVVRGRSTPRCCPARGACYPIVLFPEEASKKNV